MDFTQAWPVWILAIAIFLLRIVDVSVGTIRTIAVVNGRIRVSVLLGFIEVLIWITVISQVIARVKENPLILFAYAGGFATGNAVGIALERKLAFGYVVIRIISDGKGKEIAERLRAMGQPATVFYGEGRTGPRALVYASCARRDMGKILKAAKTIDPDMFYVVERASEASHIEMLPQPTGWRSVLKRK
jgi:uncharacterized protein YebE (UPF0316 family)